MKKILSILLAMCMLFAMFALPAVAEGETGYYLHFGDEVTFVEGNVGDTIVFPMWLTKDAKKHFVGWCTDEECTSFVWKDNQKITDQPTHYYARLKDYTTYYRDDFDSVTANDNVEQYAHLDTGSSLYHGYLMPLYGYTVPTTTDVLRSTSTKWQVSYIMMRDTNDTYASFAPNTTYHINIKYRVPEITAGTLSVKTMYGIHPYFVGPANRGKDSTTLYKKTVNFDGGSFTMVKDWTELEYDFETADLKDKSGNDVDTYIPAIGFRMAHPEGTTTFEIDYIEIQTYKTVKFSYINGEETVVEGKLYGDAIEYPALADGSKWSLDPEKYVAVPETVGEDSITVYEYNENAAARYNVNFVYANGETETKQYVEGATIAYPELAPAAYNITDNVWSGSADAWTAVPETMGAEEITVYEYHNPVMSFENYNTGYWTSAKQPNNTRISSKWAYSGKYSLKFQDINVTYLTSEPEDWSTNWAAYYEYDAETDTVTQLAGDAAPTFETNRYCNAYVPGKVDQGTIMLPIKLGETFKGPYSYKYKVSFMYHVEKCGHELYIQTQQINTGSQWFAPVKIEGGLYGKLTNAEGEDWNEYSTEISATDVKVTGDNGGQQVVIFKIFDNWNNACNNVNRKHFEIYIDDIKVEPIVEEVNVTLNRYTTAGNEVETLTGKPGDALTLPATNFFMDENWYTADGEVYTGTVFPEKDLALYTAGEFVDDEDSKTIGANFDVVKDGNDHVIYYAGTDAQVTGKDNALAIGAVEDYKTYKVAVTYKANGGNLGFNAYTAQADNMYLGTMPVNGAYTGNIYAVTESTNGEYTTAVFYISTDLYGEYTTVAGKEDTKTSNANQLYLTIQDTGASELYIKDIAVTAVDGIAADGAAKLKDADAEEAGEQAIRFFFNYKYAIENDKLYVVLGSDKYELVGRGFIYMNGYDQAIGVDNAFTLNSAYENMVVTYKDTDLNQCWSFTDDEMTFSTYVRGITEDLAGDEIMIKGYVKVLVDGQEMVIYSNTISRSVEGVEAYI